MPIIDFPFEVGTIELNALLSSVGSLAANETINGITPGNGELLPVYLAGTGTLAGNITIEGVSYIGALLSGNSAFDATPSLSKSLRATLAGVGVLDAFYEYGGGIVYLPGVVSFGAQTPTLSGLTVLNKLYNEGYSSSYTPPKTTVGFGLLLGLTGTALSVDPWIGEGYLNPIVSKGWLTAATAPIMAPGGADGFGYIPYFHNYALEGDRLEAILFGFVGAFSAQEPLGRYYARFDSTLAGVSSFLALELAINSFSSALNLAGTFNDTGLFTELVTSTGTFTTDFFHTPLFSDSFISSLALSTTFDERTVLIVDFLSSMTVGDLYNLYALAVQEFLSTLTGADTYTNVADFIANITSAVNLASIITGASLVNNPLTGNSRTWVVNLSNGASSQYDAYGFQSLARYKDTYYGLTDEGLYKLSGSTDAGFSVDALIELALSRFSTPQKKYFPSVYLGVTNAGKMLLKVTLDGTDWIYEANNDTANMANQRIDLGRGLAGAHWKFTLLNQDGDDFALESVEFLPLISSRRVY